MPSETAFEFIIIIFKISGLHVDETGCQGLESIHLFVAKIYCLWAFIIKINIKIYKMFDLHK